MTYLIVHYYIINQRIYYNTNKLCIKKVARDLSQMKTQLLPVFTLCTHFKAITKKCKGI